MTGMIKRILSAFVAAAMLLSMMTFVVLAEGGETKTTVLFTVDEADENGVFTAKLSIHNAEFLGMQFGITFNKDVIAAVDEEGNPAESFDDAVTCYPFETEESLDFMHVQKKLSNENGSIQVASVMAATQGQDLIADEEGFVAYEVRFKELADGDYGFDLMEYPYGNYEKEAIVSNGDGDLSLDFEFVCPEGKKYEFNREPVAPSEPDEPDTPSGTEPDQQGSSGVDNNATTLQEQLREERKAGTIVLQINNYAVSVNGVLKWVDKDNKNVIPYIENDRTMVPLRFISETMGAEVTWIPETRTIDIVLDETKISMQIDNTSYTLGGETKTMDVAPVIREDRTFVPLRFVSEALNKSVYWNEATSVVVVAPIDKPWDDKDSTTQQLMTDTLWMFKWLRDEAYADAK